MTEKNNPKVIWRVVLDKCLILNINIDEKIHIKIRKIGSDNNFKS